MPRHADVRAKSGRLVTATELAFDEVSFGDGLCRNDRVQEASDETRDNRIADSGEGVDAECVTNCCSSMVGKCRAVTWRWDEDV